MTLTVVSLDLELTNSDNIMTKMLAGLDDSFLNLFMGYHTIGLRYQDYNEWL